MIADVTFSILGNNENSFLEIDIFYSSEPSEKFKTFQEISVL